MMPAYRGFGFTMPARPRVAMACRLRVRSSLFADRDSVLTVENKLIAEYMSREHLFSSRVYDTATLKGYKYVVAGEADRKDGTGSNHQIDPSSAELVTVDKVWQCHGRLLRSNGVAASRRKDLCLSFALFKLLRHHLSGYPLSETPLNKTRDFIKVGLLAAAADHERLYRVVEVKLGFLFNFYYARSHVRSASDDVW